MATNKTPKTRAEKLATAREAAELRRVIQREYQASPEFLSDCLQAAIAGSVRRIYAKSRYVATQGLARASQVGAIDLRPVPDASDGADASEPSEPSITVSTTA